MVHAIAVVSPGPDFAVVLQRSLRFGRASGVITGLGIVAANLIFLIIAASGVATLLKAYPAADLAVKVLGAAFLVYLAVACLRSRGPAVQAAGEGLRSSGNASDFFTGFITSLSNPKAIVYFIGILSHLLTAHPEPHNLMTAGSVVLLISATWFTSVAVLASLRPVRDGYYRFGIWLDRLMGCVLLVFAVGLFL